MEERKEKAEKEEKAECRGKRFDEKNVEGGISRRSTHRETLLYRTDGAPIDAIRLDRSNQVRGQEDAYHARRALDKPGKERSAQIQRFAARQLTSVPSKRSTDSN
mmetsp:Transcript_20125/g.29934  ORF Transcript_20125/g.29934 Transcript_20125/m.29934 type:complete len:105 (+) Transcript_20125:96-410(+)